LRALGAEDPIKHWQQRGELVTGRCSVARHPGPAGEVGTGHHGTGVLGARDPLEDRQQRGELVTGRLALPSSQAPPSPLHYHRYQGYRQQLHQAYYHGNQGSGADLSPNHKSLHNRSTSK